MQKLLVVVMIVAACGKGGDGKGGDGKGGAGDKGGDECAAAIDHMTSLQKGDLPKQIPDAQKKKIEAMMAKTAAAIAASCRETKWSKEAIACIKGIKSLADAKQCDDKITPEQRTAAEKAGQQAMEEAQKPSADDKAAALKGIKDLRDEMCACKDAACGEAVYKKWGDVEKASEGARHDEATKEAWNKIDDELMKCKSKL